MRRRLIAAALVGALAAGSIVVMNATYPSICMSLDPEHSWTDYILWILNGCGRESTGGGGSGAGSL